MFGDVDDTTSGKREIGLLVKAELERHGLRVTWDGNPDTRLDLPGNYLAPPHTWR